MKYMLLIYTDENAWTESEREHCFVESTQLTHVLNAEGKFLGASPLHPVATATSVRVRNGKRLVTDGPFVETKELIGGFAILKADSKEHAIELTQHFLGVAGDGECELRQLYEAGPMEQVSGRQ